MINLARPGAAIMDLKSLQKRHTDGDKPIDIALHSLAACKRAPNNFISFATEQQVRSFCADAEAISPSDRGPLWGSCFAVKDNIDVKGFETTAACPAFSYTARKSAPVVHVLLQAGCIFIGKTNMDQFAAGLNGTRTPYGVPQNALDERVIPGGSSSGSGVAVGVGAVTFALGTDTAGSGRVPAGLNGVVGVKPTVGMLSTKGVVPACGSIDCVSVFAQNVSDGCTVAMEMARASTYPADHTLRFQQSIPSTLQLVAPQTITTFTYAAPADHLLDFSGPRGLEYESFCNAAMASAVDRLEALGGVRTALDFEPLCDVARMLYGSALVSERYAGIADFLSHSKDGIGAITDVGNDDRLMPITRNIINGAGSYSAVDVYAAQATLRENAAQCQAIMTEAGVHYLVVPTVMHHYLVTEIQAQEGKGSVQYNANLGKFTNFVNLLGLAAISVPAGILPSLPQQDSEQPLKCAFGITLIAADWKDPNAQLSLWALAQAFEQGMAALS